MFKNKTVGFYIGAAGGLIGLVATVIYLIYSLSVDLFAPEVFIFLLLGTLSEVLVLFVDWKFAPILPVLFFSLAFGLHINDRVLMFEEMINQIYGMNERGAILWVVLVLLALNLVSAIASIVASFSSREREQTVLRVE